MKAGNNKGRRLPKTPLCYLGALLSFLIGVPLYIDSSHSPPGTELLLRSFIALLMCLGPLVYFATHTKNAHSVGCAVVSALMLCFSLFTIFRWHFPQ
jgi:hypothetical protein